MHQLNCKYLSVLLHCGPKLYQDLAVLSVSMGVEGGKKRPFPQIIGILQASLRCCSQTDTSVSAVLTARYSTKSEAPSVCWPQFVPGGITLTETPSEEHSASYPKKKMRENMPQTKASSNLE